MKVFISGGAGFVGSFIAKKLIEQGDEPVIYDAFINYISPFESDYAHMLKLRFEDIKDKVKIIRGDIRNRGMLLKTLQEVKPDAVIQLAALPIPSISNAHPEDAIGINFNGIINMLDSIRHVDSVKRFVYTSSSMVYGNFKHSPADENHPTEPMDVYAGTKLSGEVMTKIFSKQYGINYTIIRPSAVYGPTDSYRRVTQVFVDNALKGKPLTSNNWESKMDFTYVEDLADGFVLALKSPEAVNQTFNITRGEGRSIKELAEAVKAFIPEAKIELNETSKDGNTPERGGLDISKAKKLLNYNPKYSMEEGIKKYIDFAKQNK